MIFRTIYGLLNGSIKKLSFRFELCTETSFLLIWMSILISGLFWNLLSKWMLSKFAFSMAAILLFIQKKTICTICTTSRFSKYHFYRLIFTILASRISCSTWRGTRWLKRMKKRQTLKGPYESARRYLLPVCEARGGWEAFEIDVILWCRLVGNKSIHIKLMIILWGVLLSNLVKRGCRALLCEYHLVKKYYEK